MKKTYSKYIWIPPFRLSMGTLEQLVKSLLRHFPDGTNPSLEFNYKSLSIKLKSVAELKSLLQIAATVCDFSILLSSHDHDDDKVLSVRSTTNNCYARVEGPDGAWCAAVEHDLVNVIDSNRRWYWWVRQYYGGIILWSAFILGNSFMGSRMQGSLSDWPRILAYGLFVITGILIAVFWNRAFPWGQIAIREVEPFYKRHMTEIMLIAAILTAVGSILGVILPK